MKKKIASLIFGINVIMLIFTGCGRKNKVTEEGTDASIEIIIDDTSTTTGLDFEDDSDITEYYFVSDIDFSSTVEITAPNQLNTESVDVFEQSNTEEIVDDSVAEDVIPDSTPTTEDIVVNDNTPNSDNIEDEAIHTHTWNTRTIVVAEAYDEMVCVKEAYDEEVCVDMVYIHNVTGERVDGDFITYCKTHNCKEHFPGTYDPSFRSLCGSDTGVEYKYETVHHEAVYETVHYEAVTREEFYCTGCGCVE